MPDVCMCRHWKRQVPRKLYLGRIYLVLLQEIEDRYGNRSRGDQLVRTDSAFTHSTTLVKHFPPGWTTRFDSQCCYIVTDLERTEKAKLLPSWLDGAAH